MLDNTDVDHGTPMICGVQVQSGSLKYLDKGTEVNLLIDANESEKSFQCNRYITINSSKCDAEVQTDIIDKGKTVILNPRKFNNKQSGTPQKIYVDAAVGSDCVNEEISATTFSGYTSIKKK